MIALVIILAVLAALAFLRLGVIAQFSEEGAEVTLTVGPLRFKLYPRRKKKPKARKKAEKRKAEKKKARAGEEQKRGGGLEEFKELVSISLEAAGKFRRKLKIHSLVLHFTAAAEDPAKAALMFGGANAGLGFLTALLENGFDIVYRDFQTSVSFDIKKPIVYCKARLSLMIWQIAYIGAGFAYKYYKMKRR